MITLAPLDESPGIRHAFFGRAGGVSTGIYAGLNCGFGSSDDRAAVAENRARCARYLGGVEILTVHQVHGTDVHRVETSHAPDAAPRADAMVTDRQGLALGVLTADCAPILLADARAGVIGAAHAGWKGALSGVADAVVEAMERLGADRARITAGIGPCIARDSYEVGAEFEARFLDDDATNAAFFAPGARPGKAQFDLAGYVEGRLRTAGVGRISVADTCTRADGTRFYSYRRACLAGEPDYGRQLSAIAITG